MHHAWKQLGIWESYSREMLLLQGNLCNFEGKFIILMDISVFFLQTFLKIYKIFKFLTKIWILILHFFQPLCRLTCEEPLAYQRLHVFDGRDSKSSPNMLWWFGLFRYRTDTSFWYRIGVALAGWGHWCSTVFNTTVCESFKKSQAWHSNRVCLPRGWGTQDFLL